ncbi:MAG: glycogen/starch synthase [Bacteroides sp.]|nr:glycogen/starch synthase [Roseburia sp.]MCM1346770.1 glycogen/starch synthase [Bacteroides sp.]MCM1420664.1 glycogen/starch synthase [Bacteroides sp.]
MPKKLLTPDLIFESSWEVCNKVGGIYTVLSTRAKTLQDAMTDKVIFIGPDFWIGEKNPLFKESKTLLSKWRKHAKDIDGLDIRIGRWLIPGEPIAVLVDFKPFFNQKNDIYAWAWDHYQVDSLHAYGDYDEASMFSYAAGKIVESYYRFYGLKPSDKVVYQAHEWMTGLGALYVQKAVPSVATIFTTHATSIGRSIAGNGKPLYDYLFAYNGDQMALELNMQSKHSIEKQTAMNVDCFTTVSDITANECKELLDCPADVVLMNGFENDFVPQTGVPFDEARKAARKKMLAVANALMGTSLGDDTLIISTGGRYEYKNKGIDLFVDSLNRLRHDDRLEREVLAFIMVPAWMKEAREDLKAKLAKNNIDGCACDNPRITHELHNQGEDSVLGQMNWLDMYNRPEDKVKVVFVPCYLDGNDGIFNMHYYDLLIGNDICIYPSYYEPWGYTPTESVAFHVPCITTDLAGFGLWANSLKKGNSEIADGVKTVHRSDFNFDEVANSICDTLVEFSKMDGKTVAKVRKKAAAIAEKALWKHFIKYYYKAYDIALTNAGKRVSR